MLACLDVAFALLIESGVEGVVVPGVEVFLHGAQGVAEALEVHDFAFAEEANDVFDVGVVDQAQDVVVGQAGLLFGRQILVQVGQGIAGRLQGGRRKGIAGRGLRIDAGRVVDIVGVKAAGLDFSRGEVAGELEDDGADHLGVAKLLGADVGQHALALLIGHGVALAKIAGRSAHFAVGAAQLGDNDLGQGGVGRGDLNRVFQTFFIDPHG